MIVPLVSVRLREPIDTHDQRNQLQLDAAHGWELALDDDHRFILCRWRKSGSTEGDWWTCEFPVEHARHWVRVGDNEAGEYHVPTWASGDEKPAKGKKR